MYNELNDRLAFSMLKNLNSSLADQLLGRIGMERSLFEMSADQLHTISRLPLETVSDEAREELKKKAHKELDFILGNNITPLYYRDADYPSRLLECEDAPVMLYKLGACNLDAKYTIAIVGTRHATPYGLEMTSRIVGELAKSLDDIVIVSGLAYGIDVAAHKAALANNIPTVAVTAHSLNTLYPPEHRGVAANIIHEGGAIVTEYSTSHEFFKTNFLARNRIIAGLSDITIVVESDSKGGSLTTAGLAMEYNREVFAVPGRITDKYSRGTIALIATNRAHIYTTCEEMLAEVGWEAKNTDDPQLPLDFEMNEHERKIYDFLMQHPASRLNEIMIGTGMSQLNVKDVLFNLEMRDMVMSMAGGKYSALS